MSELKNPYEDLDPVKPRVDTFVTARNSDLTEGKGRNVYEKYFDNIDEAIAAAKGISTQGSDGDVYYIESLLPDKKVLVWGYHWNKELSVSFHGYVPGTNWYKGGDLVERIKNTDRYKKYVSEKEIYEKYGL